LILPNKLLGYYVLFELGNVFYDGRFNVIPTKFRHPAGGSCCCGFGLFVSANNVFSPNGDVLLLLLVFSYYLLIWLFLIFLSA
jgi:hypothetical protein